MHTAKIQIKIGDIVFTGEGDKQWISQQIDKILLSVPHLIKLEASKPELAATVAKAFGKPTSVPEASSIFKGF